MRDLLHFEAIELKHVAKMSLVGERKTLMTMLAEPVILASKQANEIAACFVRSFLLSDEKAYPYRHWLMRHALPDPFARLLAALPFPAPDRMTHDGRRETNNTKRIYFNRAHQRQFQVCADFVEAFNSTSMREFLHSMTGADLDDALLRVEYCQETGSFWLEPHTDISVKKFTMLIYLSDDPALTNCGTDIYDATPDHTLVHTAPYAFNGGLIFVPSADTWHGFHRRDINGIRKSLIVNYVAPDWRDRWELAE